MLVQKLVQNSHPYLIRRGNVFCFRYVLPLHVRRLCPELPREIKRSLKTDSFPEALYLVNRKAELIRQIKLSRDKTQLQRLCGCLADFDGIYDESFGFSVVSAQVASQEVPTLGRQRTRQEASVGQTEFTLSEAWSGFVRGKHWSDKFSRYNQSLMDNLIFFLGDVPVSQISKFDLKQALEAIRGLPQRNRKRYHGRSLEELTQIAIPPEHRVSSKTVKEHLKLCQGLFSRYLVKELDVLKTSPTNGLMLEHEDSRFACLGDSQVRDILSRAEKKPDWVRWFLYLAAYSGARRSELARLKTEDFKQCPDTGRYYFVIQEGKTRAARRRVPLHPVLEQAGFLDWITRMDGPVFPTAVANPNRVTEHFGSLVEEKNNDLGERVVLHSLRHTFITKARAAGASTVLVQQVVGHEKTGAGVTDRYTHTFPLKDLLGVVDGVYYGVNGKAISTRPRHCE